METNPTTTEAVPRKRRPKAHPARRARLAAGSASAVSMLALTGWMAAGAHANTSAATTNRAAAVTTTQAAGSGTASSASTASSAGTQSSYSSAQAATPTSQVTTSSHGS
jgi:hypothetical protein